MAKSVSELRKRGVSAVANKMKAGEVLDPGQDVNVEEISRKGEVELDRYRQMPDGSLHEYPEDTMMADEDLPDDDEVIPASSAAKYLVKKYQGGPRGAASKTLLGRISKN